MAVHKVLVVGGGITGSVLSLALAQRGAEVELAEISPQWFGVGHGITVQGNALKALRSVGVLDRVLARAVPFDVLRLRRADGGLLAELRTRTPAVPSCRRRRARCARTFRTRCATRSTRGGCASGSR
ncbi:FAD-dependent monooxygenase [Streptomyces mirabilis]|nr:FAD-dependent monooxygenase [Streptomyces mirabilis]